MAEESRTVRDPICGKEVDTFRARAVGIYAGVTYYFCSADCKSKYVDPRKNATAPRPDGPERRSAMRTGETALPPTAAAPLAVAAPASLPSTQPPSAADTSGPPSAFDDGEPESGPSGQKRSSMVYLAIGVAVAGGLALLVLR